MGRTPQILNRGNTTTRPNPNPNPDLKLILILIRNLKSALNLNLKPNPNPNPDPQYFTNANRNRHLALAYAASGLHRSTGREGRHRLGRSMEGTTGTLTPIETTSEKKNFRHHPRAMTIEIFNFSSLVHSRRIEFFAVLNAVQNIERPVSSCFVSNVAR